MILKKFINFKKFTCAALAAAVLSALLLTVSCGGGNNGDGDESGADKPVVAVTIVPEETFVKAVCGENVTTVTLVPPGGSPETYEPTPMVMEKFEKADLFFAIGVPVEEANIIPRAPRSVKIIKLQDKVGSVYADRSFDSGGRDPHIWLSPKRVKVMIDAIAREVCALDPKNTAVYNANAAAYKEKLDALDAEILAALEGVHNRKFITYHPAFSYLADDYNLTMYALEEEGKEATMSHLQEMIDLAKAERIKVIFYQEEIDSSQSKAFAEEIGGKTIRLAPLAADYIDNLKKMAKVMAENME